MENHDKCIKKCIIVNPGNNYQLQSSISGHIVGLYCNSPWQTVIIQELQGNIYNPILPSTHPWDNPCCDEWKHGTPWTGCKCITGLSNRGEWFRTLTFTSMRISLESAVDPNVHVFSLREEAKYQNVQGACPNCTWKGPEPKALFLSDHSTTH